MNILSLPLMLATIASYSVEKPSYTLISSPLPSASGLYAGTGPAPQPGRRELTVLTYNVHGLPWPISKGGRKQAIKAIGEHLGQMRREGRAPDIVLIQEGFEDIHELVKLSGYRYWATGPQKKDRSDPDEAPDATGFERVRYVASGEGWGKLTSSGLHILSDFPIMGVDEEPYAYCAGWDCLANKGVMMVHIDIPGVPGGVDVATTHLNSWDTAKVPDARAHMAHHLQLDEINTFIDRHRSEGAALIVGGDFNVRDSPERYYYKALSRPYTVVSEYCKQPGVTCASELPMDVAEPWLRSEDLEAFAQGAVVTVRPRDIRMTFDNLDGARLSDHDGYVVRYELSWR